MQLTEILLYELKEEEKAREILPSLEELVNDRAPDDIMSRAAELRRTLQDENDFVKDSLPTVQQMLDEALDEDANAKVTKADAKHLQNTEDVRKEAYLKKMGSKYEQIKKQKIGYRGRKGGGRKEEIVPLSNSAFRGFENRRPRKKSLAADKKKLVEGRG